jgi:hypothetical protein
MFKKRGQGQSWSLDIILAFVVFVLIIGIFYALVNNNKKDTTQDLTLESNTIVSSLDSANGQTSNNLTIIDSGVVDDAKLSELYGSDYNAIKRQLGVKGEFCIYLIDQNGMLVAVENSAGQELGSFGNGNYTVNDNPCGSALS